MKPSSATLISVALLASVLGAAYFLGSRVAHEPHAEPASLPAAASNAWSRERAPLVDETGRGTSERRRQLALEIERSLVASDPQQRETAFNVLLPELIETEPARVVALVARQEPGEVRDALRDEVARQWIRLDREAAIDWMGSLNENERRASATIATRALAAASPAQAIYVADLFGVGRDDGSLEHMVQIWAIENPAEATHWIESQPPNDPRTEQLRTRIEQVRAQQHATLQ